MTEVNFEHVPRGIRPEHIGQIVLFQVFDKSKDVEGEIVPDSLKKYYGTLEGYHFDSKTFSFIMFGKDFQFWGLNSYIEFYNPIDMLARDDWDDQVRNERWIEITGGEDEEWVRKAKKFFLGDNYGSLIQINPPKPN